RRPAPRTTRPCSFDNATGSAAGPGRRRQGQRAAGPRGLVVDLVEGLARLDQAQLGARTRLDRLVAVLEVGHVGGQRLVALLQARVLVGLLLDRYAQGIHFMHAAV